MKANVKYGILLPIVVAVTTVLWVLPADSLGIEGLTVTQQRTIAIFAFAALMWIFEIVPNWVTSLMVIVGSLLTISDKSLSFAMHTDDGSIFMSSKELMRSFSDPVIMLFLGGFVLAIVASKYGMDVKMARLLLKPFGKRPRAILLGFLVIISVFSMFMSNTATAAMFLTFLSPVLATLPEGERGRTGLAMAIPLAANVGGIGTPIGTPPNATAMGVMESAGISMTFGDWAFRMIPFVIIMVLIAWALLLFFFPFGTKEITIEIPKKETKRTWRTYVAWITFALTIILWMTEQWTGLNANVVALIPLVVYTATGVFTAEDVKEINWTVLWLVAGGFALGYALNDTGLAKTLISSIDFGSMSVALVFVVAGFVCYFLSNFISNSATAALLLPIMVAMGRGLMESTNAEAFAHLGGQPALIAFVAMSASLAMLLPISTPPNALASSTGMVKTNDMVKVGIIIGAIGLALGYFWVTRLMPFPVN